MITDDDLVRAGRALHDRFGEERAEAFAARLPQVVQQVSECWGLQVQQLLPSGATSVVLVVAAVGDREGHQVGRREAVLKVSPDTPFLARQSAMLRRLAVSGRVPQVYAESRELGAVLLERIAPGHTVDSSRSAAPTPEEWARLVSDLHRTDPQGIGDTLADRCEEMIERIGARQRRPQVREHVTDSLWSRTVTEIRAIVASDSDDVVIHGDLHLGNVLDGGERGLVAIDPKLCVGDRCFDLVDYVVVDGEVDDMLRRATAVAPAVGVALDRLLAWSAVNAVVTTTSLLARSGPSRRTATLLALAERHAQQ